MVPPSSTGPAKEDLIGALSCSSLSPIDIDAVQSSSESDVAPSTLLLLSRLAACFCLAPVVLPLLLSHLAVAAVGAMMFVAGDVGPTSAAGDLLAMIGCRGIPAEEVVGGLAAGGDRRGAAARTRGGA